MRTGRKSRKRLQAEKEKEQLQLQLRAASAFRMTRRRRIALAPLKLERLAKWQLRDSQANRLLRRNGRRIRLERTISETLQAAFSKAVHRLDRRGKRRMRNRAARRQTAAAVSVSTLALLPTVGTEAASVHMMREIPAAFQALKDSRNRIRDFHVAQRNAHEAAVALVQAEAALQSARQDQRNAVAGLAEAQENLLAAKKNLARVGRELDRARQESARRTEEAIAAQQAVADYAPNIWNQEASIQGLTTDRSEVQQNYAALQSELGVNTQKQSDLAQRIEAAWQSVNYEQNRLEDVVAMVNELRQEQGGMSDRSAEVNAFESRLQELDTAIDEQESLLDVMNAQLDSLRDSQAAAEDAEREARQLVTELIQEEKEAQKEQTDAELWQKEAIQWKQAADKSVTDSERDKASTEDWKRQADYELAHFGEGRGIGAGLEYYHWSGSGLPDGHQLYQPLSFYAAEKNVELSLTTGWLDSDTGLKNGHVSGWTDTELGLLYKNDHPKYDVHYGLDLNLPTGCDNVHQNAMMADNLAAFATFSEGWKVTPSVAVIHHITERDSLSGKLSFIFRGDYNYRTSMSVADMAQRQLQEAELQEQINPANQLQQEISYQHIGEHKQFQARLTHLNASHADYRSVIQSWTWAAGSSGTLNQDYGSGRNTDGEDWTLRLYHNQDIDARNAWQAYGIADYQSSDTGGMHRYYTGLGWSHQFTAQKFGYVLLNYGVTRGLNYNWRTDKWDEGRHIYSVILGYDCQLDSRSALQTKFERYWIHGSATDSYQGWNTSVMFIRSF